MTIMLRRILIALWVAVSAFPAIAADNILRIGIGFLSFRGGQPYQGITLPSVTAHQAVYDYLTGVGENGIVEPALALSWTAETPRSWVFKLRPGVSYSNEEPFNADAVAASAEYMATTKGRSETIGSTMYQVERAEKIDDLTVRVHLNEPDGLFPLHASSWRLPAPEAFKKLGNEGFQTHPVGTGPFVVTEWVTGHAIMKANPKSWRKAKVAGLEIREIPEETSRLQALASGAIDIAQSLAADQKSYLDEVGAQLFRRPTPNVVFLAAHTVPATSPLKDPRVRYALNLAVNRQKLIDQVMAGATTPAAQLSFPGAFGYNPDVAAYPYDPDQAKKLLAEAGHGQGLKLQVGITAGTRASDTLYFQQIAADLQRVGVTLELIARPQQAQMLEMFNGKLTVDLFSMYSRGYDAMADYRHRSCSGLTQGRAAFHCDPKVTPALQAALAEQDATKRLALYKEVARLERESPPGIILWQSMEFDALAKGISGYAPVFEDLRLHLIEKK